MGLTQYERALTSTDFIRVRIVSERGRVIDFTIQYEATIDGKIYPVVRYDAAHDTPHRDLLDQAGRNIDKHWMLGRTYAQVVNEAIADLLAHWRQYREDFIGRMP